MRKWKKTYKVSCSSYYNGVLIDFLVVPTLIWKGNKKGNIDEFVVSLAVSNSSLRNLGYGRITDSGGWTEIAHSDHNPVSGHDIYDKSDSKQLHVDVNHPYYGYKYAEVYVRLANGSPPKPVGKAADRAKEILRIQRKRFFKDYLP